MNFKINSQTLLAAVGIVCKALPSAKALSPHCDTILIRRDGENLILTATDNNTFCSVRVKPDTVTGNDDLALFASALLNALTLMDGFDISIEKNANSIDISYPNGNMSFPLMETKDFPLIPAMPDAGASIRSALVKDGITDVSFAIGDNDLRPQLSGVRFDFRADGMSFVGTDARRLVCYDTPLKVEKPFGVTICAAVCKIILLAIAQYKDDIDVVFATTGKRHFVRIGEVTVSSSVLSDKYPRYQDVIPRNYTNKLTIERARILDTAIRIAASVGGKGGKNERTVVFALSKNGTLVLSCEDIAMSVRSKETLAGLDYAGEDVLIGLQADFLIETLQHRKSEFVVISFGSNGRLPILIEDKPDGDGNADPIASIVIPKMTNESPESR